MGTLRIRRILRRVAWRASGKPAIEAIRTCQGRSASVCANTNRGTGAVQRFPFDSFMVRCRKSGKRRNGRAMRNEYLPISIPITAITGSATDHFAVDFALVSHRIGVLPSMHSLRQKPSPTSSAGVRPDHPFAKQTDYRACTFADEATVKDQEAIGPQLGVPAATARIDIVRGKVVSWRGRCLSC